MSECKDHAEDERPWMCTCTARKITELHRRAQIAEGIIARSGIVEGRPQMAAGRSMGRALANYAAAKHERERDAARKVLRLIEQHGGKTTDNGVVCNGSWCAEQARAFLSTSNNGFKVGADAPYLASTGSATRSETATK